MGPKPEGMKLQLLRSDNYGRMLIQWTPCDAHIGSHVVCLSADDSQGGSMSAASEQACIKVQVLPDPAPYFDLSQGKTHTEAVKVTIGRESSFELYAADDNCLDHIEISIEDMPPGAALVKRPAPREECTYAHSTLRWTPAYDYGGWNADVCFTVSDAGGSCGKAVHKVEHCVRVFVERCVYAVQPDQQLQEVAAFYEATWMQMWSLNQGLGHPDIMMYDNQVIMIGHKYRAGPKETAGGVAKRMGMPMHQFQLLNYDLRQQLNSSADVKLQPQQELCLIPNSCKGMGKTHFSEIKYIDEGSLAKYASDAIPLPASEAV